MKFVLNGKCFEAGLVSAEVFLFKVCIEADSMARLRLDLLTAGGRVNSFGRSAIVPSGKSRAEKVDRLQCPLYYVVCRIQRGRDESMRF